MIKKLEKRFHKGLVNSERAAKVIVACVGGTVLAIFLIFIMLVLSEAIHELMEIY